jgi:osmoprotectant transport system ATP-binding protein
MIEFEQATRRYGDIAAVDEVSLCIEGGEFFVIVGSSGAGKSTLLRMINGLIPCSAGTIRIGGRDIRTLKAEDLRRRLGYVIQSIGLFPHWTVARNIAAVPDLLGWPAEKIRARTLALLALLKLDPEVYLDKYPHQLSIGQQQRVGIARALAADPEGLLMDEPFAALDPITREALQREIASIHRGSGKTIIFVTHDMNEALTLASRIAVMDQGRVVQVGTPVELLTRPGNDFVRSLVGRDDAGLMLLSTEKVADGMRHGAGEGGPSIAVEASLRQALSRMLLVRAECLAVVDGAGRTIGTIDIGDLVRRR